MKTIFKPDNGKLFGVLLGMFIVLAGIYGYRKIIVPYSMTLPHIISDTSRVVKKQDFFEHINTVKTEQLSISERVASINKRIDDLIVFGGIIVTLLLAINVSVYIRADAQVEKHFRTNFENHKLKADTYLAVISKAAERANSELSMMKQQPTNTIIKTITDDDRSGESATHT